MTRKEKTSLRSRVVSDTQQFLEQALEGCRFDDPHSLPCLNVNYRLNQFFRQMADINRRAQWRAGQRRPRSGPQPD